MLSRPSRGDRTACPARVEWRSSGIRRRPSRGVRPGFSAVHREESVGHLPQCVEKRALCIRRWPSRGVGPSFAAGRREERVRHSRHAEVSVGHSSQAVAAFAAGRREECVRHSQQSVEREAPGILSKPTRGERPACS